MNNNTDKDFCAECQRIHAGDKDYVVYAARKQNGAIKIYFWTGEVFTGDVSKAKIHHRYAECIPTIWKGTLDANMSKLQSMGFKGLHPIPLKYVDESLPLDIRATDEVNF